MGFLNILTSLGSLIPGVGPFIGAAGNLASGLGGSMANNRGNQNDYQSRNNQTLANIYGTQQGATTGQYGIQQGAQTSQYNTQQQAALQALLARATQDQNNVGNDLNRRQFALNAPSTRAGQAVRGSILQTLQPSTMSGGSSRLRAATPTINGGFSAANLNPDAREAGRLLEEGALKGLRDGDTFDALPNTDFQSGVLTPPGLINPPDLVNPPSLAGYQQPGTGESILGILGAIAPLLAGFRNHNRSGGAEPSDENGYG